MRKEINKIDDWKGLADTFQLKNEDDPSMRRLLRMCRLSYNISKHVYETSSNEELLELCRLNSIINVVSALEVFCKQLIIEKKANWKEESFTQFFKEKITINEAFDIISIHRIEGIEKAHLLAGFSSFKNLDSILKVFSGLTLKDNLLDFLGKLECRILNNDTPDKVQPGWKAILANLFILRNEIVHDDYTANPTLEEVKEMQFASLHFAIALHQWVDNFQSNRK